MVTVVCREVVCGVVVLMAIEVEVLFGDLDFRDTHNVDHLLGKVSDYGLWFYQGLAGGPNVEMSNF